MAEITLETAKRHLDAWLEAELAVTNAQSYTIGSRTMTKANLTEISKIWRQEPCKTICTTGFIKHCP